MNIFIIVDYNFEAPQDISVSKCFTSLEKAFEVALEDVKQCKGDKITLHNSPKNFGEDLEYNTNRLSNNNSLGSNYGISYKSNYGGFKCSRIIIQRKLEEV